MSQDEFTLVCEGQPRGRDIRWLGLTLGYLAQSFEPAGRVRVVSGGSKADLAATVRGMREALGTRRIYAIRDRDFLRADLLDKDVSAGVYSLERYCIESYFVEPALLEAVFPLKNSEGLLNTIAERHFWPGIGRAVLDTCGYQLRAFRLSIADEMPASKADVVKIAKARLDEYRRGVASGDLDIETIADTFERDMRTAPLWTRVSGKDVLNALEQELRGSVLPGGDLEGRLFKWCALNGPPGPLTADVKRILENVLAVP